MISVVVPIFNEEEVIPLFHHAVAEALNDICEDWEAVYVNDGSRDSSLELLRELQAADPHIVVVDLSRNWGHMGAITAGLQTARGDAVVVMDGDFQDPPNVVPELVNAWRNGAQVVVAVRRSRKERRKILAMLFPLFYRVLGAISDFPIPLDAGIFSLLDRQAVESINSMQETNRYLPGLRAWVGYRSAVVFYDRQDRVAGDGKLSFVSRIKYAADAVTSFSYKPLRLCFVLSLFSSFVALALSISAIFSSSQLISMGLFLAATIFFVGCLLLFCLGVLSEYLGRVYDQVRSRPLSIINRVYYSSEMISAQVRTEYEKEDAEAISPSGVRLAVVSQGRRL